MAEPFNGNARAFISWAREARWTKLTEKDELRITSASELSATLQKQYGWSSRDADAKVNKAFFIMESF